jgi:hypothetical protein
LKTKDGSRKKKAKRLQAIETARVRVAVAEGVSEVCSRYHKKAYYRSGRLSIVNL